MPPRHPDVPADLLAVVRTACLGLPEAHEEAAWLGTRWRIRKKTFAHILMVDRGRPAAYARAAGSDGPICVLTFRSWLAEFDPDSFRQPPFFRPGWWPDIVGMVLGAPVDRTEVTALLAASYRVMAPQKLAKSIALPPRSAP